MSTNIASFHGVNHVIAVIPAEKVLHVVGTQFVIVCLNRIEQTLRLHEAVRVAAKKYSASHSGGDLARHSSRPNHWSPVPRRDKMETFVLEYVSAT